MCMQNGTCVQTCVLLYEPVFVCMHTAATYSPCRSLCTSPQTSWDVMAWNVFCQWRPEARTTLQGCFEWVCQLTAHAVECPTAIKTTAHSVKCPTVKTTAHGVQCPTAAKTTASLKKVMTATSLSLSLLSSTIHDCFDTEWNLVLVISQAHFRVICLNFQPKKLLWLFFIPFLSTRVITLLPFRLP